MKRENIFKLRKGITVVEIITSLSILSILGMLAVAVLSVSIRAERITTDEFHTQSNIRYVIDHFSHNIRYATAVFVMPESSFNSTHIDTSLEFIPYTGAGLLSERWNYHGIIDNKILSYVWQESPAGHRRRIHLTSNEDDIDIYLRFSQIDAMDMDDTLVEFQLKVTRDGVANPLIDIMTAADSLNAMQVVDWSSNVSPGRAIAYRLDEVLRDIPVGRVALILDVSGSMDRMDILTPNPIPGLPDIPISRMQALIESANALIGAFSGIENLYMTVIPYSTTANFLHPNIFNQAEFADMRTYKAALFGTDYTFQSVHQNATAFENVIGSLAASGGTNIGDGMRRGYFAFVGGGLDPYDREIIEYFILMTDGEPNMATVIPGPPARNWNAEVALANNGTLFHKGPGNTMVNIANANMITNRYVASIFSNSSTALPSMTNNVTTSSPIAWEPYNFHDLVYKTMTLPYMQYFGERITSRTNHTYFVAFSPDQDFQNSPRLLDVANTLLIPHGDIFRAGDMEDLVEAFETIANSIVLDLWHAAGPNLVPPAGGP